METAQEYQPYHRIVLGYRNLSIAMGLSRVISKAFPRTSPVRLAKPGLALSSDCDSLIRDEPPVEFREILHPSRKTVFF